MTQNMSEKPKAGRPNGVKETSPRKPGGGRKPSETYAQRYAADPDGSSIIRLPNVVLAHFERQAQAEGLTVAQWLGRMETDSRII